ncbi:nitrate/nitrite transporter NarK [Asanoa ferruginea]|uniref:Nitrate/nitrite transporter NarK n=1 Tax=Asanoa ferruginea TaxID=53367 RepID=A0A3D9ZQC5_9ACTN|nr:MFS transporter [Asanoa ferruginea]REF99377.1 nitrate/nitrite transporter NarK [Asanoa ferruginea]GIF45981.1 MFS transporter [Asanoa ferruginea]
MDTRDEPGTGRSLLLTPGPSRLLIAVSLLGSVGLGLYQAGSVVYFVKYVGLTTTQVGLGLSVAGLIGLFCGLPIGHLVDRFGPRRIAIVLACAKAATLLGALAAENFWHFLPIVMLLSIAESGLVVSNEAVIAGLVSGLARVRLAAWLRSAFNVGLAAGSMLAGLALAVGTTTAYRGLIGSYVVISLLVGWLYARLPAVATAEHAGRRSWIRALAGLRDRPYLVMAQVLCLSQLGDIVLTVGLPLWVVSFTHAPTSFAAWLGTINTVLVALLQVRLARFAETVAASVRAQYWALGLMAICCVLAGAASSVATWSAVALLVTAVIALTIGEMLGQSARWQLRFSFAAADAQGAYGAAFRLGLIVPFALGPLLVTALISNLRFGGWLILAAIFVAGMAASRFAIAWAESTRPPEAERASAAEVAR